MLKTQDLGHGISLIDVYDLKKEQRTGSYVLQDEGGEVTIIETSASPSIPYLLEGLEAMDIDLESVKNVIVTHIHLDHAGGAGLFLEKCPNATVIVHQKGERHLANPSKLIQGAKAVYGEQFDELFDPILPIPKDRLIVKQDHEKLQVGKDRTLTFYNTPGHAKHHFSIHDSRSNGIFTGDTIGVHYPQLLAYDLELYLPSTSPNQFNPEEMMESANLIESLQVDSIYFGHFGKSENPKEVFNQLRAWVPRFVDIGVKVLSEMPEDAFEQKSEAIFKGLYTMVSGYLDENDVPRSAAVYSIIELDLKVCAMGIIDYIQKK